MPLLVDVDHALKELTIEEKVKLLSGKDNWSTYPIERLDIPSLVATDGPHGARGTSFFNGPLGALLPSATAMGATFDTRLMRSVGNMLAAETMEKGCQILLAPTVCLQRSPLIGRGFEAFGEDPILSGMLASEYINGVQEKGVATSIKHYAAHDQSYMSPEDDLQVAERTLREVHLLPFQLAVKHANPWSFMTSYHRINGVHTSENEWLNTQILRREWEWDGLLMSDWGWCDLLHLALMSRKVTKSMINERVRNVVKLVNRVQPAIKHTTPNEEAGDTPTKRALCREVAQGSIVLLKNERKVLPLDPSAQQTYGLIGPGVIYPAVSGGGSADLRPYYVQKPLEAIQDVVGREKVRTAVGCYCRPTSRISIFTPPLSEYVTVPGTDEEGYQLFWYGEDPETNPEAEPLHSTTTTQATMYFADSHPSGVPDMYWLRVVTLYRATKTATMHIGLCVMGKGRLYIDGKAAIDLWSSHPKKTLQTPMFNQASMELTADLEAHEGQVYEISVLLKNETMSSNIGGPYVGTSCIGGVRIGCCEKIDPAVALAEAVEVARNVDVPILIAGLNADYETEAVDRHDLELPPGINELVRRVIEANPKTIIVNQSGCPVTMPWVNNASTLVQAWFGGQETGNAIADVLFGRYNPSGRLSITFPRRLEDTPSFLSFGKGVRHMYYGEGVFIGHRYYEKLRNDPLFYFGFGLSYTTFEYSNLQLPEVVDLGDNGERTFNVSVDVMNTGDMDGHEIVQLYVSDIECATLRPCKELKGFAKLWVPKGGKVKATISLDKYAVSYWDEEEKKWLAEKGTFKVVISRSADPKDEVLQRQFRLERDLYWRGV
ncbi:glycoside hydrolase superfamily [Fusarium oxysporum]|nr:glycoside hydrolase superfamily [Fusarium oxysporum]